MLFIFHVLGGDYNVCIFDHKLVSFSTMLTDMFLVPFKAVLQKDMEAKNDNQNSSQYYKIPERFWSLKFR